MQLCITEILDIENFDKALYSITLNEKLESIFLKVIFYTYLVQKTTLIK